MVLLAGCTAQTQETNKAFQAQNIQSGVTYFAVSDYKLSKLDLNVFHPLIADKMRWNTSQITFYSKIKDDTNYPIIKSGINAWNSATKAIKFVETDNPENAYFTIRYASSGELNKPLDGAVVVIGEAKVDYTNTGLFNLSKSADMIYTPVGGCANNVTVIHELGHILGLGHTDEASSVMFKYVDCNAKITDGMKKAVEALYSTKELPDLYFSSIDAKRIDHKVEINFTISNRGIITSQNTSAKITANDKIVGIFDVPPIEGGKDWWKIAELSDLTSNYITIELLRRMNSVQKIT